MFLELVCTCLDMGIKVLHCAVLFIELHFETRFFRIFRISHALAVSVRGFLYKAKINGEVSHISFGKNKKVTLTKLNIVLRYCKHVFLGGIGTCLDVGIKLLPHAVLFLSYISKLAFSGFLGGFAGFP